MFDLIIVKLIRDDKSICPVGRRYYNEANTYLSVESDVWMDGWWLNFQGLYMYITENTYVAKTN